MSITTLESDSSSWAKFGRFMGLFLSPSPSQHSIATDQVFDSYDISLLSCQISLLTIVGVVLLLLWLIIFLSFKRITSFTRFMILMFLVNTWFVSLLGPFAFSLVIWSCLKFQFLSGCSLIDSHLIFLKEVL